MKLGSDEYFNFILDSHKITDELQSSYLALFFMLGVNESIFNLAIKIHQDYKHHNKISKRYFIKSYVFSDVLPFINLDINTIKIYPIINSNINSSCTRKNNDIIIHLNDFSLLTLIHELNHIFDNTKVFPINKDKQLTYFHSRMKDDKYKIFTHSLYLSSSAEIKSRTVEFFTYLLVHHYIINKWETPLKFNYLWYLFSDSVFYFDAISLQNASLESFYDTDDKMNDLIINYNFYVKKYEYRNRIMKECKSFIRFRLFLYNLFFKKQKKHIPSKLINMFKEKYNNFFKHAGNVICVDLKEL